MVPTRDFGDWQMAFQSVRADELCAQLVYLPWQEVWTSKSHDGARHFIQYFHDIMSVRR